ncbi:MAG TPA: cupredoxin domain-containing protein [Nitrospiria bacterium]|nr:cupredoxin domain-containing protein [Nitrospiria bacterium]
MIRRMLLPACLLLAAPALASTVCASGDEPEVPAAPARQITVRLSEYQFAPSKIVLKAGETVELTLINEGTVTHEFVTLALSSLEVTVTTAGVETETVGVVEVELQPRSQAQLRFTPDTAGEYPFACHANKPADHATLGMMGTLIVK